MCRCPVPLQVNVADREGMTVLHLTAKQGVHTVFRFLLSHGADRELRTAEGLTVEQLATPSVKKVLQGEWERRGREGEGRGRMREREGGVEKGWKE